MRVRSSESLGPADDLPARPGQLTSPVPPEIALIGGGRWARLWARVLASQLPQPRVHWVSSRNRDGLAAWLADQGAAGGPAPSRVDLYAELDELIAAARPPVAIVANLPAEHGRAARALIEHGCHVLVEKPFVSTREEAEALVALADRRERVLGVGLELMLASYVQGFRRFIEERRLEFVAAEVVWHDVYREFRSLALKTPDLTTGIVGDLLPHVLSLLTALRGPAGVDVDMVVPGRGGLEARLRLRYGGLPIGVSLSRVADWPARVLRFETATGARYALDFTTEPGKIITPSGEAIPDGR
jgi:predicted dehydrogenase